MIDFNPLYQQIAATTLSHWLEVLPAQLADWHRNQLHGNFRHWKKTIDHLPLLYPQTLDIENRIYADTPALTHRQREGIQTLLKQLMPWRKGPFELYGTEINTEWRSDWKWDRILPHLSPLKDKMILDVGCGSGYHLWRMVGRQASLAIGIDPMQLFVCQFEAVRKLLGNDRRVHVLPLGIEQLPELNGFDTVFSMGVLYHRRSPLEHLTQLKQQLINGGELVLETLVIPGDSFQVLVPGDRYAKMRNVYFIPSALALKNWLEKCGFVDVRVVDEEWTSFEEQRKTDWMTTESLSDFLDPVDRYKTCEGYSAPLRAVLVAKKPAPRL